MQVTPFQGERINENVNKTILEKIILHHIEALGSRIKK